MGSRKFNRELNLVLSKHRLKLNFFLLLNLPLNFDSNLKVDSAEAISEREQKHALRLPAHSAVADKEFLCGGLGEGGGTFAAALSGAPSGKSTTRAFGARFMAGKGFHSWALLPPFFFSAESGAEFDYVLASVFAVDGE